MSRTGDLTPAQWQRMKDERKVVRSYLKVGGTYVKGPFAGFNRQQRRVLERIERAKKKELRGFRARQRAEAIEERLEQLREGQGGSGVDQRLGLLDKLKGAVSGIFGRGRQKK